MVAMNSVLSASRRRRGRGRPFVKGMSGNPNGRPKIVFEIRDLAQQYGPAAITRLAELSGLAPGTPAQAEATQVAALKELLDRGYGRATQPLAGDDNASPLAIDFRWADAPPEPSAPEPESVTDVGDMDVVFAADAC